MIGQGQRLSKLVEEGLGTGIGCLLYTSRHGAAAGLRNHFQGETVVLEPFIHTGDLCVYRIASCDAKGLQDLEISPVKDGHLLPRCV